MDAFASPDTSSCFADCGGVVHGGGGRVRDGYNHELNAGDFAPFLRCVAWGRKEKALPEIFYPQETEGRQQVGEFREKVLSCVCCAFLSMESLASWRVEGTNNSVLESGKICFIHNSILRIATVEVSRANKEYTVHRPRRRSRHRTVFLFFCLCDRPPADCEDRPEKIRTQHSERWHRRAEKRGHSETTHPHDPKHGNNTRVRSA